MLISGKSCTIQEIFSGQLLIQIPDMQRDYCWANTKSDLNGKSLVENFLDDLINQIGSKNSIQMGLLYAYESPKNHIQLCDGQQRLTTIYLIIGILYRYLKNEDIEDVIKDVIVFNDDSQLMPRLQYAIRETTLSFLSDLVTEIFIKGRSLENVKKEDWYFLEYNNDPSIQNILVALEIIHKNLIGLENKQDLADLLLTRITFLYFDMVNRTYGEEQFVVLNTTGKPLTKTENIKPKLLGDLDDKTTEEQFKNITQLRYYADLWEEWELHFWRNRSVDHQTADNGLNEFFRWVYIIKKSETEGVLSSQTEKYNDAQKALSSHRYNIFEIENTNSKILDIINSYFKFIKVIENDDDIKSRLLYTKEPLSQIQCFELLPLLNFIKKYSIKDINNRDYQRFKYFLNNRAKDENVSKASITTTVEAIRISQLMNRDLVLFDAYEKNISTTLFNACERYKFKVLLNNDDRNVIEESFWKSEKLETSHGNIAYIFDALDIKLKDDVVGFNLEEFNKVAYLINHIFERPTDLLRRTLLTFGDYYVWHGHTSSLQAHRYTLGSDAKFYGELANGDDLDKKQVVISFIKKSLLGIEKDAPDAIQIWMHRQIDNFESRGSTIFDRTRYSLIKDTELHNFMNNKLFCISYDEKSSYVLKSQKVTAEDTYREIINLA